MDALVTPSYPMITACARRFFIPPASIQRKIPRALFGANATRRALIQRLTAPRRHASHSGLARNAGFRWWRLFALGAGWPDDVHRLSALAGVGDYVAGPA